MPSQNSPVITKLLEEFKAQDHSVELVVVQGQKRIIAAKFSEGNQCWEPTQAGIDLVFPPEEKEEEKKPVKRNIDVRQPKTTK